MNYNYLIKNCKISPQKLVGEGFAQQGDAFTRRVDLLNGLYVWVEICPKASTLNIEVYDELFNEKYSPFYSGHGGAAIKSQVREIVEGVIARCGTTQNVAESVFRHIQSTYGVSPVYPWEDDATSATFKAPKSQKWFALYMEITEKQLGLPTDEKVSVLNIKLPPQTIQQITDRQHYFPAYHMNKLHWLTVRLDATTNWEEVKSLIDQSFRLVEKK